MAGTKRVRVEIALLDDDVIYLDKLAELQLTTRGDLIREAIYAHFPQLRERHETFIESLIADARRERKQSNG